MLNPTWPLVSAGSSCLLILGRRKLMLWSAAGARLVRPDSETRNFCCPRDDFLANIFCIFQMIGVYSVLNSCGRKEDAMLWAHWISHEAVSTINSRTERDTASTTTSEEIGNPLPSCLRWVFPLLCTDSPKIYSHLRRRNSKHLGGVPCIIYPWFISQSEAYAKQHAN